VWSSLGIDHKEGEPAAQEPSYSTENPPVQPTAITDRPEQRALESVGESDAPFASPIWNVGSEKTGETTVEPAVESAGVQSTTSYIERFAHMFADEPSATEVGDGSPQHDAVRLGISTAAPPAASRTALGASAPPADAEEESIEEYMAKLLQRVRGEAGGSGASEPRAIADAQPASLNPTADGTRGPLPAITPVSALIESTSRRQTSREVSSRAARRWPA
jgi:hypothetical protein